MEELESGLLTECCDLLNTISTYPENKKCFDCCDNYSPRYLCTTFSTFVCSCCANIHHKEFGHTIKVLSVFSFTLNEIYILKETGNRVAADKWLARWRADLFKEPDPTSPTYKEDARKYMKAKYIEKRWVKLPPALPIPGSKSEGDEAGEPRGYEDVSPRKVIPDGAVPLEPSFVQQHGDKSVVQQALRDPYAAPIMYLPQPMYIPVSMPQVMPQGIPQIPMAMPTVSQYGYTQYHVPQPDMGQLPPPPPYHYGPLYTYPYDNKHCYPPTIIAEGVSWPGASRPKKKRPVTTAISPQEGDVPQQFTSIEELPPVPPGTILRSVSDNSIVTHYVLQAPGSRKEVSAPCLDCNTQDTKQASNDSQASATKSNNNIPSKADTKINTVSKGDSKLKLAGIMNKVAGFLGKKS